MPASFSNVVEGLCEAKRILRFKVKIWFLKQAGEWDVLFLLFERYLFVRFLKPEATQSHLL